MSVLAGKLDTWLAAHEAKFAGAAASPSINPDSAIVPADELSAQALEAQARTHGLSF